MHFGDFGFGSLRIGKTTYGHDLVIECERLVIGTGAYGRLPVMEEVKHEAERRKVELLIVPTSKAIQLVEKDPAANAILHVTC